MVRCSDVRVFGCLWIRSSLHSVRFGQLLRLSHRRIVNILKVYIERNNIQVGIYCRNRRVHCYPLRVATGSWFAGRFGTWPLRYTPFRDIFNSVHSHFRTCPIRSISYRDKHDSGLHNSTISSYYVQAVRTVQSPIQLVDLRLHYKIWRLDNLCVLNET